MDTSAGGQALEWARTNAPGGCVSVALSSDGTKLVAAQGGPGYTGYIFTSIDSAATWTQTGAKQQWTSVTSSADGKTLAAASAYISYPVSQDVNTECDSGYIFTSLDSGATWTQTGPQDEWTSVGSSGDGTKLVAVSEGGYISTSGNVLESPGLRVHHRLASAATSTVLGRPWRRQLTERGSSQWTTACFPNSAAPTSIRQRIPACPGR